MFLSLVICVQVVGSLKIKNLEVIGSFKIKIWKLLEVESWKWKWKLLEVGSWKRKLLEVEIRNLKFLKFEFFKILCIVSWLLIKFN